MGAKSIKNRLLIWFSIKGIVSFLNQLVMGHNEYDKQKKPQTQ